MTLEELIAEWLGKGIGDEAEARPLAGVQWQIWDESQPADRAGTGRTYYPAVLDSRDGYCDADRDGEADPDAGGREPNPNTIEIIFQQAARERYYSGGLGAWEVTVALQARADCSAARAVYMRLIDLAEEDPDSPIAGAEVAESTYGYDPDGFPAPFGGVTTFVFTAERDPRSDGYSDSHTPGG